MIKKRLMAFVLAMLITASLLGACSGGSTENTTEPAVQQTEPDNVSGEDTAVYTLNPNLSLIKATFELTTVRSFSVNEA